MRAYLPVILVLLAVFTAGCIIYIAWELSSESSEKASDASGSDDLPGDKDRH
jgi:flagellar basal body-associated protein FliL